MALKQLLSPSAILNGCSASRFTCEIQHPNKIICLANYMFNKGVSRGSGVFDSPVAIVGSGPFVTAVMYNSSRTDLRWI